MRFLNKIKHVVMDLDGTVYEGSVLYPTTLPFLADLDVHGIRYSFATNNTSSGRVSYFHKLKAIGIPIRSPEQILTPVISVNAFLKQKLSANAKLWILGSDDFREEMRMLKWSVIPYSDHETVPDYVIVAFDLTLDYEKLCKTAWWIKQNIPWLATHPDVACPTNLPTCLVDCGAVTACLEKATGIPCPNVFGKPHPDMLQTIMLQENLIPDEIMMVGDRELTDIASGAAAGAVTIRIYQGNPSDIQTAADYVCKNLGEISQLPTFSKND